MGDVLTAPSPIARGSDRIPALENGAPPIPRLENGDHLSATEFLRRYEQMPDLKKAELIDGIVYIMASPVRQTLHGKPNALAQTWLGTYAVATPGTEPGSDSTVRLGPDDVAQPDALLFLSSEYGGHSRLDATGYIEGPPELVIEIAASSVSIDTREKLTSYRRARVREYIVWRTEDAAIDWWHLEEDEYRPLPIDADGIARSLVFPGLWLSISAMLASDGAKVLSALQAGLASPEHAAFVTDLKARHAH